MSEYLKKTNPPLQERDASTRNIVESILNDIRARGESAVRELAEKLDNWTGDFVLEDEVIDNLTASLPQSVKENIRFAHDQISNFASMQRKAIQEFEAELYPGVTVGQKLIPCQSAGCYVPGGRFAHISSALMSIATAKAAGVPFIVACTPPRGESINPMVAYAMTLAGADVIMALGGVQAVAAMAFGLFTGRPVDIVVGPGNAFVAEAKRQLYGEIGIDLFAGPSEMLVIAEKTADPLLIAVDITSQCEHGYDSPAWLLTDSRELAEKVIEIMPKVISDLPNPEVAASAWENYGEVVLCEDREELALVSDQYAAEHVQVFAHDLDWYKENLKNYGSLFLGEACTICYGDKTSGPNHILPTGKTARYSGGLNVGSFIKTLTYQKLTSEANRSIGAVASCISRYEGMEGHARAADIRLRKYFPDETFEFEVYQHRVHG